METLHKQPMLTLITSLKKADWSGKQNRLSANGFKNKSHLHTMVQEININITLTHHASHYDSKECFSSECNGVFEHSLAKDMSMSVIDLQGHNFRKSWITWCHNFCVFVCLLCVCKRCDIREEIPSKLLEEAVVAKRTSSGSVANSESEKKIILKE